MNLRQTPRDHSWAVKAFRIYLQYINSHLYFRKQHVIGLENVPVNGTPLVVVSNHQNCLNDPLCVSLKLTDRRMNFLARANVFNNPVFNKMLRAMGLLPAYRMQYEGFAAVMKNKDTFDAVGNALTSGETVMLYPEVGHQDKHWLGNFSMGYLKLAFDAAARFDFKRDVMILPSCNHYSNYFHARTDMLIKFGKPVSLQPYYARYRENPRAVMTEINQIVRGEIQGMMLNIEDLEHYPQIDFIRQSGYGNRYAIKHGFNPRYLPSKLLSDQKLVAALDTAHQTSPDAMNAVYDDTRTLLDGIAELDIKDWLFDEHQSWFRFLIRALGLLILLPLYAVAIGPTALMFLIPKIFLKALIKDKMFISSFNVAVSAILTVPVCLILPVVLLWVYAGFWWAFGYFVAFPLMFVLAWNYMRLWVKMLGTLRFVRRRNRKRVRELSALRKSIFERLDAILGEQ